MERATFDIHLSVNSSENRIVMNGTDISAQVVSVNAVKPSPFEPPVVILEVLADSVDVTGEGVTYLDRGATDVIDVLAALNPNELEAEALERAPMGASVTAAVIDIIKERISGPPT